MFYKTIENNIITELGYPTAQSNSTEITEEEYNTILSVIANKPEDTLETIYILSAETNQYKPYTRTHNETVEWYAQKVISKEITLEEVPAEYYNEVYEIINSLDPTQSEEYMAGYEQALLDLAEVE